MERREGQQPAEGGGGQRRLVPVRVEAGFAIPMNPQLVQPRFGPAMPLPQPMQVQQVQTQQPERAVPVQGAVPQQIQMPQNIPIQQQPANRRRRRPRRTRNRETERERYNRERRERDR